ncbi:DNA polymerase [Nitrospirillum iridis]|uniref:DNA-directed DNA polymerase n=1 Tax=Nitrospirillum iridis TaxID=765888 RepID=A0A7X0AZM7_9PROT|nr:DNA polymerase [Nitrospirillum iridis]MBB6253043.1 DNA polymerase-1 [Nitrospirillum iridis]
MRDPRGAHALADWGERLGFPKGDHSDWTQFSYEMAEYCRRDVDVTRKVWEALEAYRNAFPGPCACEHRVGLILAQQEQHGFKLDRELARGIEGDLRQELTDIERELQQIFPPIIHERYSAKTGKRLKDKIEVFNPGSRPQIAKRLKDKYDWESPEFTPQGAPKIDESTLAQALFPEAKALLRYFRCLKMLGQVSDGDNAWLKLERQGYVHGAVNQCGAGTHRMSHFKPNVAQVDKDSLMRSCWGPDPGHVQVGCDAEGLEARMLGHYLARYDGGAFADRVLNGDKAKGTDIHSVNLKALSNLMVHAWSGKSITIGLRTRDGAKTYLYALMYGAGLWKLGFTILSDMRAAGVDFPAAWLKKGSKQCTAIGKLSSKAITAGMTGIDKLIADVQQAAKRGHLRALDGRHLNVRSAHSALNTLLQGGGAIVMKYALVILADRLEAAGLYQPYRPVLKDALLRGDYRDWVHFLANVHDEWQMSCPPEHAQRVGEIAKQSITDAGVRLGVKCRLDGSFDVGSNWKETH